MKNQILFPKVSARLSQSGEAIILQDELGSKILVSTNLIKHVLEIPFVKKDGSRKTADQIRADHMRAREAYIAKLSAVR